MVRRLAIPLLAALLLPLAGCPSEEPPPVDDDDTTPAADDDDAVDDDDSGPDDDDSADDDDAVDDDDSSDDDDDDSSDDDDATPADCWADAYEPNDDSAAAYEVPLPSMSESFMTLCEGDEDWFVLSDMLVGGLIEVETFTIPGFDLDLELYGPGGDVVAVSAGPDADERILHYTYEPGDYTARAFQPAAPETLPWVLYNFEMSVDAAPLLCASDALEPNNDAAMATPITTTTYIDLSVCIGDEDWYGIEADAGATLEIDLQHAEVEGNVDLFLYDAGGVEIASSISTTDDEAISHTVADAGAYLLQVVLQDDPGAIPGNLYTLSLAGATAACVPDVWEPNDVPPEVPALPNGVYLEQTICPGDDDWYGLDLNAAETFTFDLGYLSAEGNVDVYLWDNAGLTQYVSGTNPGDDENWVWQVPATAGYMLQVTLESDAGVMTGNVYDMDITSVLTIQCSTDVYEPNDDITNAAWLPSAGLYGALNACESEPDYYLFPMQPGEDEIDITLTWDDADGELFLVLYAPDGDLIDISAGGGSPQSIVAPTEGVGQYVIGVEVAADYGADDGLFYDLDLIIWSR